ncbi:MAG: META domain-containing protein [Xanthobacteraceae bacterium]
MARRHIARSPDDRRIGRHLFVAATVALLAVVGATVTRASAQSDFPFGRELLMDTTPMPGSKRVPILDIAENGLAEITLWCATVKARLIVVADTITVLIGPKTTPSCSPEQSQRDENLLASLSQATNWRLEQDVLVLSGGPAALRFYLQTN